MDISKEELEAFNKKYMLQQEQNRKLTEDEEFYIKQNKEYFCDLDLLWSDKIEIVDTEFLFGKLELVDSEDFINSYTIVLLNLHDTLKVYLETQKRIEKIYSSKKLWKSIRRNDRKLTILINYINSNKTLCPPVISYRINEHSSNKPVFCVFDGNHRIALSRYIGLEEIPFIIHKSDWLELQRIMPN
ncbi:hypothetical protein [Olleya namhaensis]|uniref:hypothetical protein n=1 Tax=Olleya namhaensis TaxID=1144750 RepID=UPI0024938E77|nr:hypothetical protein [Olleya namhaensis]